MKLGYSLLAAYELKLYFPKYKDTSIGIEDLYKAQKSYEPNPPTCTYIIIQKKPPKTAHRTVSTFYTA